MAYLEFSERTMSYIGASTDTKPAGRVGEKLHEFNTGKIFVHTGERWVEDLTLIYAHSAALKE